MEASGQSLEDVFREQLPFIDDLLSRSHAPLHSRPFEASCVFVREVILDVSDGSKEKFLEQPWFKALFAAARAWYTERYGAALNPPRAPLRSAILLGGVAFALHVPRTTQRPHEDGVSAWLTFPSQVQDSESPLTWIVSPPNLAAFGESERSGIHAQVVEHAAALRTIWLDVGSAAASDSVAEALAEKVLVHLQASADRLLESRGAELRLAIWDAHQAVESILKLLVRQRSGTHPATHRLDELIGQVAFSAGAAVDLGLLAQLPSAARVIALRAGEGPDESLDKAFATYGAALRLTRQCSSHLVGKGLRAHDVSFLIGRVPWA